MKKGIFYYDRALCETTPNEQVQNEAGMREERRKKREQTKKMQPFVFILANIRTIFSKTAQQVFE